MSSPVQKRRSLFQRPEEPRAMRMTPRDINILHNIARYRLITATQLAELDGGSAQNVSRSLLVLFEHGFVERPLAQATSRFLYKGARSTIYGLTRKGARLLREYGHDVRRSLLGGIDKERGAGWRFIEHTVSITQFLVALEVGVRSREGLRILGSAEVLEDGARSTRDQQVRISATISLDGTLKTNAVLPDAVFGLRFSDDEESYFMLEIDRGEMPIERYTDLYRTYFAKKLLTYYEASRQQRYIHDLGISNFRVATVTTTLERVDQMLEALNRITEGRGSSIFLFTDERTLGASNPLDVEWVSGQEQLVQLTD
jgi:DNA-binding transcriptional ArsR family regulator